MLNENSTTLSIPPYYIEIACISPHGVMVTIFLNDPEDEITAILVLDGKQWSELAAAVTCIDTMRRTLK